VVAQDRQAVVDGQDATPNADHGIAPIARSALYRLEDERETVVVVKSQGGGHR
jgi:hypothetical protein